MKLELHDHEVKVKHIASQRAKENTPLYCAISISIDSIPTSAVAAILGCREQEIEPSFFRKSKEGSKRKFKGWDSIDSNREFAGKHMVKFGDLSELRVTRLYNITLHPLSAGVFGAEMHLQVEPQLPETFWELHHMQHKLVPLTLQQDAAADLLDTDEEDEIAEERQAQEKAAAKPKADTLEEQSGASMH